jgi:hypothetical protein
VDRARDKLFLLWPLLIFCAVGMGGLLLAGQSFVFYDEPAIWRGLAIACLLLYPPALYFFSRHQADADLKRDFPTTWLRKAVIFPVLLGLHVAVVAASPLGWLMTWAALSGQPRHAVPALVASVEEVTERYCSRYATLVLANQMTTVCISGTFARNTLSPGDELDAQVSLHAGGFFIHALHPPAVASSSAS